MKKLLSAVTSAVMATSVMTSAFASLPVSAAGSLSVSQPNFSMGEVLDVSANKTASDGSVEWLIPTVTAAPGQTVTLPVVAKNSSLAVAGAQFNVDAASPIKYKSVTGGDAYTSTIGDNGKGTKFLFDDSNGIEKVAAEGATVFTLAYTIPEDCAEGTYAVKWSNGNVSDTDGFNITSKVKFTDGAIKVVKDSGEGKIDWVLDKVTGYPGETVSVKAYVSNKDNAAVAVAGAQYKIDVDAESNIKYKSFKSGGAYVSDISINESKTSFLFDHNAGLGVVAANDATIMTLTYTIPEDCKPGEYPVKWSKQFVSDTDGFDLTSRINFLDGAIVVKDGTPANGQVSWVLDNVKGEKGKSVTVKAVVSDPKSSALAVAGAQFKVKTDDKNINYKSFTAGTAYPSDMSANEDKNSFMFRTSSGKAVSAANGSTILAITYDIPANCPDGVYPVSWSDAFVSDADGYNLTDNVIFKDGSITVGDVDVQDGSVSWVIPKVEGKKGEDVTLQVKVAGKGDLPVAGAQFEIAGSAPTSYKSATGKPYGEDLRSNDKQKFEFFTASGDGKTAKAGDELFTLTFSVPADCPDGVYPVSWAKQFVSDTDGFGITDKVNFVDGAIYVNTPIPVETTTTTTTLTTITTTTTTVVPVPEGGIAWQIGTKQAEPGQTVTLDIKVVDPNNNKLAIGGAQFIIENDKAVTYGTAKGSDAYKSELSTNDAIKKSLFKSETGKGIAAANDDVVATLTFTVPADCAIGKYPVNFADGTLKVFDEDGYDLSKLVEGRNGWIEVVPHVTTTLAPNQSTQTTTSTSGTGKVDSSSTSTESTQSTSSVSTQSTAPISTE
ncbi:cohesin domain-containing protein, partial [Ruminococcus flavefaciens]|uniref:cohesin domain-containing protein n=1 Tax=Ruminococcus flavefaciens TaxID=1265 RepID=UPI00055FF47A